MKEKSRILIFILLIAIGFWGINRVVFFEQHYFSGYEENYLESAVGFQNLPDHSLDVAICGSSNVFLDISPLDLYRAYGYKAYNLASPMQTLQQSYFQISSMFKSQSPKVLLLDCLGFTAYQENSEEYTHMAYDGFPLSKLKTECLAEYLLEEYDRNHFIMPFLLYHNRYRELDADDYNFEFYKAEEDFCGYSPAFVTAQVTAQIFASRQQDTVLSEKAQNTFEKIVEICNSNDCELILIKTPSSAWYVEDSERMYQLADQYGLQFWDMNTITAIDIEKDWSDDGGHLNDQGAQKIAASLGQKLLNYIGRDHLIEDKSAAIYFDERVHCLDKCRSIHELRNTADIAGLKTKLNTADYLIGINAGLHDLDFRKDDKSEPDNRISTVIDGAGNLLAVDSAKEKSVLEFYADGHVFYLENDGNRSILQLDYHNYSVKQDADIHMIVYDKYYGCIVDIININQSGGIQTVTHY